MMKRFVSLTVCFTAMICGANAESPGSFAIGIGTNSCGRFIATIGKHPPGMIETMPTGDGDFISENVEYQQWLLGFVSGFNAAHGAEQEQQVTRIDGAGTDLWMRNWCNKHPTKTVSEGAVAFINEMRAGRR
jgi:hypothetical protein